MSLLMTGITRAKNEMSWPTFLLFICHFLVLIVWGIANSIKGALGYRPDPVSGPHEVLDGLWRFTGSTNNIKNNMWVMRLPSGGLLLHNFVEPTDVVVDGLAELGDVEIMVVGSVFHDTHVEAFKAKYPDARTVSIRSSMELAMADEAAEDVLPKLGFKVYDYAEHLRIGDLGHSETTYVTDIDGKRVAFVTDLIGNDHDPSWLLRLGGFYGLRMFRNYRLVLVRHLEALRKAVADMAMAEQIDFVCVSHGDPVTENGSIALITAVNAGL